MYYLFVFGKAKGIVSHSSTHRNSIHASLGVYDSTTHQIMEREFGLEL
jgi:hypothetical protein